MARFAGFTMHVDIAVTSWFIRLVEVTQIKDSSADSIVGPSGSTADAWVSQIEADSLTWTEGL